LAECPECHAKFDHWLARRRDIVIPSHVEQPFLARNAIASSNASGVGPPCMAT
jgi:hypothetical protein